MDTWLFESTFTLEEAYSTFPSTCILASPYKVSAYIFYSYGWCWHLPELRPFTLTILSGIVASITDG